MRLSYNIFFIVLGLLLLSACSISRRVPEGQYLLTKNRIKIDTRDVSRSDLDRLIRQQPNRRLLGFYRFHLRAYNLGDYGKENRIKKTLKNTIGEPPVILDTVMAITSLNQQLLYLNNKGFFNATGHKDISFRRRNKAVVTYNLKAGQPYIVNDIKYTIEDPNIVPHIFYDTINSLIQRGERYDVNVMQKERERMTKFLKNRGYYRFSREFIRFEVDSALGHHAVNINVLVMSPVAKTTDSIEPLRKVPHRRYIINDIYVYPKFRAHRQDAQKLDTMLVQIPDRRQEGAFNNYFFVGSEAPHINSPVITQSIFFRQGRFFNLEDVEQTYRSLSGLRNFRFINIHFFENKDTLQDDLIMRALDSRIELTPLPLLYYDIATDVTNSGGNLGLAGNFSFQNRNLFRNAELFSLRLNGALEAQRILSDDGSEDVYEQLPFNTVEAGVSIGLDIPQFLIPVSQERFPKYFRPKTTIRSGLNYQRRPDYTRYIFNTSFGYEWSESSSKKHMLNPLEISSVKITPDSSFIEIVNAIRDRRLQLSYQDHLSVSLKYSFIYNTQEVGKMRDFTYFRGNIETSGNVLRGINSLLGSNQDEFGSYKIFNIRYAQYIKLDVDYRYYYVLNKHNTFVFRTAGGIGIPYGNLRVMPFDKSFFVGGANGIRAWKLFQLGPGSYSDDSGMRLYRTGDIYLESNVEYRFDIYKLLEGALFVDAGNIWYREKNEQFPGAEFKLDNFYKQIAIGGGFGLRLDFSFFIVRLDAAIPIRDPAKAPNDRWVVNNMKMSRVNFNLGIGYPF